MQLALFQICYCVQLVIDSFYMQIGYIKNGKTIYRPNCFYYTFNCCVIIFLKNLLNLSIMFSIAVLKLFSYAAHWLKGQGYSISNLN